MSSPTSPPKSEVLNQLSKILRSQVFRNSDMLRNFLSFIVQEAIKEKGMVLKQYSIAIHAFGRNPDFDATIDPIVRIQASRLRRNLEQYYKEEGIEDEIMIALPKGSYMPEFSQISLENQTNTPPLNNSDVSSNSIALFPLKNLSAKNDMQQIVEGFSEELVMELGRYKHLQIVRMHEIDNATTKNAFARFSLEGSMRYSKHTIKISIGVVDNHSQILLWSYQQKFDIEKCNLIKVQEDVASAVAHQIAGMNGVLPEKLYAESNWENMQNPTAYATYLHFYKYTKDPTPEHAAELLEKVTQVVEKEPEFALGWAVLTRLYTDAYQFSQNQEFLNKALEFGEKATELQPNNQACQTYYAYALMANNQLGKSQWHCEIGLSLNPNSVHYAGAIGFLYCLMDKLEKGYELIQRSIEVDFQYPKWFHIGTFLYFLKKRDYNRALIEANKFDKSVYWSSLIKLVACHKLQQNKQASLHLEELKEIKPDFFEMSLEYIKSMVKAEFAVKEIFESLEAVSNYTSETITTK